MMDMDLKNYSYEARPPTTINQCLNDLIAGYADSDVYLELGKHFMELIEDEYFLQWPIVLYRYASNPLRGYFCGRSDDDYISGNRELGLKLLIPMAEAGLATAQYELGRYYEMYENNIDLGLEWLIKASKQECHRAQKYMKCVWSHSIYRNASMNTQKEYLIELARIYKGQEPEENVKEELSKLDQRNGEQKHGKSIS